jgi:excisionase family DNA binding protein
MAQKFTSLEDAADQLGISKDRLNQLREAGKVRAYRDGASWKFRAEDIEKLENEGIPQIEPPPSDINLDLDDEDLPTPSAAPASEADLQATDDDHARDAAASDLNLDDVEEPTVAGIDEGGSDDALAIDLDSDAINMSDSILLSEAELGESAGRPPSTIIGKAELDKEADLDLAAEPDEAHGPKSDVQLAQQSDIIVGADDDLALDLPSPSGDFEGLEELEVDLEAASSRILSPEDVAKVKGGMAAKQQEAAEISDLQLAPTDSDVGNRATSDIGLGSDVSSGTGLTGLSALELEDDDDQVLGEGSDVTLSGESSGINIISPSDSGLALDDVQLDLAGASPIGSSLDLGVGSGVGEDVGLEPLMVGEGLEESAGEDFQLTPLGEEAAEDEERDSSQVIELDEVTEEAGEPLGVSESGMMADDFAAVGLTPGVAPVGVVSAAETPFSLANVLGLASCLLLLSLCGMMAYDLMRNIWSWDGVTRYNSALLEVLNPFL